MKLERIQEYVLPTVVILGGIVFALALGKLMGEGQFSKVALFLGGLFLCFVTLMMRQYIWLLVIIAWPWAGQIPILPLPFAVRDLAIFAVFAATLALVALKVVRRRPTYNSLDLLLALLLVYMLIVFIRNPVGTNATNSFRVGGRPYLNAAIAFLAYWVLCRSSLQLRGASWIFIGCTLASNFAIAALNIVCDFSTRIARVMINFYTDIAAAADFNQTPQPFNLPPEVTRRTYLSNFGLPINLTLASLYRPLEVVNPLYFWRLGVLLFGMVMLLLSGFRNTILATFGFMFISGYLRAGLFEVIKMAIIGAIFLGVLAAGNGRLYELPLAAQRALSFLPGRWNVAATQDAAGSTQWRVQMWIAMLSSDRYIQNRTFGDGFGISKRDLETINRLNTRPGNDQESVMILGNVHSGPISTVRVAGYVGFGLFMILLIAMAIHAVRLVRRSLGTSVAPMAFFIGLPIIYEPFNFVVIFGGFDAALSTTIFSLGLMKMLENTLNDHEPAVVPEPVSDPSVPLHRRQVSRPAAVLALRHSD